MNGDFEARRPKVESRRSVGPKSNQVASAGQVGRRPASIVSTARPLVLCRPKDSHLWPVFHFGVAAAVNQVPSAENVAH